MKPTNIESAPFANLDNDLANDFQFWTVTENGDIGRPDMPSFLIPHDSLLGQNWLTQEIEKERHANTACAESEFYFVFMEALRRAGYKKITIDVSNKYAPIEGIKEKNCIPQ